MYKRQLLFVVNLVRTRKLKEEFALLWLLTAVVLVLAPLFIDYLDMVAHALGIEYPPAFIFVLAIISVLLILFQFSMRLSHFSDQIKALTQELALLRARLEPSNHLQAAKRPSISRQTRRKGISTMTTTPGLRTPLLSIRAKRLSNRSGTEYQCHSKQSEGIL